MMEWVHTWTIRWHVLKASLSERLAYRGDFALGTLMRFLPVITQIFLWWAIFQAIDPEKPDAARLAGYSFREMVAYYLLTMVARAFSSMPGLSSSIAQRVRNGEIKKFIVQPIDLISFLFWSRVAHKLAYYFVATLPFALVFFLCRDYFPNGWPEWPLRLHSAFIWKRVSDSSDFGCWKSHRYCSSTCCFSFSSQGICSRSTSCGSLGGRLSTVCQSST
jgi:ABC-2 type transport system permease protein